MRSPSVMNADGRNILASVLLAQVGVRVLSSSLLRSVETHEFLNSLTPELACKMHGFAWCLVGLLLTSWWRDVFMFFTMCCVRLGQRECSLPLTLCVFCFHLFSSMLLCVSV